MKTQHSPPQSGRRLAHPSSQVRAGWGDPEWLSTAGTPAGPEGRWSVETPCSPAGPRPTSFAATAGPSSPVSPAIRQGPLSRVRAKLEEAQDALCPQEETHNTVGGLGVHDGDGVTASASVLHQLILPGGLTQIPEVAPPTGVQHLGRKGEGRTRDLENLPGPGSRQLVHTPGTAPPAQGALLACVAPTHPTPPPQARRPLHP